MNILMGRAATGGTVTLAARLANRHGLITGATGTGKTVTLLTLAEGFSRAGVPVFIPDVKGDVSGLAMPGTPSDKLSARARQVGADGFTTEGSPTIFWDLFGKSGHPMRATVAGMGTTLLASMFELNGTQSGALDILFKVAEDRNIPLIDLHDLRALLNLMLDDRKAISRKYGLISGSSVGAIQRSLLRLQSDGGDNLYGKPALELADLMLSAPDGRGMVSILAADSLILNPRLYAGFMLWLLSELFEKLPEVGDLDKPRLVFIFDEAHLIFDSAPRPLLKRVEQVVRLIRSKGVGVYFCSQLPTDIPQNVLGQLGNKVQHALRAFTPKDRRAIKAASESFTPNAAVDVAEAIAGMGTGVALVSTLQDGGRPSPVERVTVAPPRCRMGAITDAERAAIMAISPVGAKYDNQTVTASAADAIGEHVAPTDSVHPLNHGAGVRELILAESVIEDAERLRLDMEFRDAEMDAKIAADKARLADTDTAPAKTGRKRQGFAQSVAKSTARSIGTTSLRRLLGF